MARVEAAIQLGKKSELSGQPNIAAAVRGLPWSPNRKERSEYWLRLKARVADALSRRPYLHNEGSIPVVKSLQRS